MTCPLKKHLQQRFQNSSHLGKGRGRVRDDKDDPFGLNDIEEDTIQTLGADLAVLKEKFGDEVDLNITPDEFTNFDIEVATTHARLSNQEILADINDDQVDVSDNENDGSVEGEPVIKSGIEEARKAIQTLQNLKKQ